MTTRVAVVQMVSGHVVADNLERARLRVLEAARGGAALVVLPEYFALMGLADTDKLAVAEAFGHGPMQDAVAQMAREAGVWLVAGTLPLAGQNPGRVRNSCLVFSPAGECVARYDKIHLFGEMTALVLPAAFTAVTGEAHWEVLLRARAIENQCYAIAAAQGGVHSSGRRTHGHSMIIDPWGRIVAELPEGEGVLWADLDPALLASVRNRLPALRHRVLQCRA